MDAAFSDRGSAGRASLNEVLKIWEGLGYYSRARHLHAAAKELVEKYKGQLPSEREALAGIKGLGPYTIGAILSFAFHKRAAAVDGNAVRVLSRYFAIKEDVQKASTLKRIWEIAEAILPDEEPWLVVEGLIELGASVCKRQAKCWACPLQQGCLSFKEGLQGEIPKKGKKVETTTICRDVFVITCQDHLLLKKGVKGKVMADLYEFPYLEREKSRFPFELRASKIKALPEVFHCFTRFKVQLYPTLWRAVEKVEVPHHEWILFSDVEKLPFSSGHKKIMASIASLKS